MGFFAFLIHISFFFLLQYAAMFYSFRVGNNNLSSFTNAQKNQVKRFQDFIMEKPDGFCCLCLKVLYPEERRFRTFEDETNLPCLSWKLQPLCDSEDPAKKMVCKSHVNTPEEDFVSLKMVYPGKVYNCYFFFQVYALLICI